MDNPATYIVFFDGHCALCHFWVRKILQKDTKKQFQFASLQSAYARAFIAERGLEKEDSLVVWQVGVAYWLRYPAVCVISKALGGGFAFLLLGRLLPPFIPDGLYRLVAAGRKRWFGAYAQCPLPDPQFQDRFLV